MSTPRRRRDHEPATAVFDTREAPMPPSDLLFARIRGEFREMPGLRLTLAQACRLWQLDAVTCEFLLQMLVAETFLARTKDGAFVARSADAHPVTVTLHPDAATPVHVLRRRA
jgi:hypothetical protein